MGIIRQYRTTQVSRVQRAAVTHCCNWPRVIEWPACNARLMQDRDALTSFVVMPGLCKPNPQGEIANTKV